ncbi:MAG: Tetratricopeptide 2 repeat protein [Acidobacteria bacterium]|nr:Tetratricopeptide 2 repeat protein [Acidobacteriota bacterium]
MRLSVGAVLLVLLAAVCPAQTSEEITTEAQLSSALCSVERDERSRADLLKNYPHLVDSRLVENINRRAVNAYYQESPERALKIYDVSIQVGLKLGQPGLLGKTYYNLARTFSGLNQPEKAIESYTKSSEYFERASLKRDLIYVLADLGALYFNKEDYQRAKDYSERSILIADSVNSHDIPAGSYPDNFGRARALHTLAEIDLRNSEHENAIEKLNKALTLYQALNAQGSNYAYYLAGVYAALGKVYPEIGDYTRALLNLNKALDIANASRDEDTIANILNSIGYLYLEQEDYTQAKEHFDRSLKVYLVAKNQVEASRVLLNLGVVEQRQTHYDAALARFQLSLLAAKASQNTDVQIAAGEGVGVVLTAKRNLTEALAVLNESLSTAKQNGNKTREIELTWRSAQTLYEMENYGEAAIRGEASVSLARSAHLPKLEYLATTTLGQIYAAQGKVEPAKEQLVRATQQLESLRDQVAGRETASQLYFENKLTSYHSLVDILAQQQKPVEALLYAERAKARVLLDVVSGSKIDFSKSLTPAERDQQLRLNRNIADLNERAKRSVGPVGDPLYSQLDTARLEYQAFQDVIYITHPDLRRRSGRTTELSAAEVPDLTATDTAYLEYVVTRGKVWLFVLTKDPSNSVAEIRSYQLGIEPRELLNKVNLFHDRLANRHPEYASLALELYRVLLSPAEMQLRHTTFCIVPDSFLWNLPFQALMTKDGHFLIEDHSLYYAPSLSVLREMKRKSSTNERTDSSLIAFGNPVIGKDEQRNEELCPLPEAEAEVNSIANSFSPTRRKVLIGREATEKTFRSLATTYSTIHLATHGIIDNRQPLYSHLLLTKSEGDPENDGLLEAREIMNMSLQADLAVLSACETANGTISPGEGVVGMSWAFFVAGTRSMLVSQWKVNSESTSQLMKNFYQPPRANNKAMALQHSALSLMKGQEYRHPFYWAGFVLIGKN